MYRENQILMMPYNCETLGSYTPLDCEADPFFYNKVVAVGIIKNPAKDFSLPATFDYADFAALEGDIEVIDNVKGEYDGGEPEVSTEAYGSKLEQVISRKHTLTFEVEYNSKNWAFFNGLTKARNYGVVFLTGEYEELNFSGKVDVTFATKTPVTRERNQVRNFVVTATWTNLDLAQPVAVTEAIIDLFK